LANTLNSYIFIQQLDFYFLNKFQNPRKISNFCFNTPKYHHIPKPAGVNLYFNCSGTEQNTAQEILLVYFISIKAGLNQSSGVTSGVTWSRLKWKARATISF
jgi:hypothetical protein